MTPLIFLWGTPDTFPNYQHAVLAAGGRCLLSQQFSAAQHCQGLLLPGGGDPDPALYGQKNAGSHLPDPDRDRAELLLIRRFTEAKKPILGICRGLQILNIFFGGTLLQDIPNHGQLQETDRLHAICAVPHSFPHRLYGPDFSVNSAHHQAADRLGQGLSAAAWSADGILEAFWHQTLPVFAVQWHPERLTGAFASSDAADGSLLFRFFLSQCSHEAC